MDCARNIITANFSGGGTSATTAPLWQWDYGQVLCITGIDLPAAFEVHFSTNRTGGVSTTAVGADGQVTIPNVLLTIGKNLNAWIYLSDSEGEGETEYSILIPVKARPMPETYDAEVSGEFDDVVRQVSEYAETAQTAADNAGASASAAAASADSATASASAAETAKNAAETAQGKAEDAQAAAETAAQTATEKAQQTAQDAAQAAQSKADAESAAQSAETAQTGAESAKTDAETAAQGAADSASAASASATSAGQAASAAAQSATEAAQSAASIEGDVQIASQKAAEAQTAAGQTVAAKDAAVTAQQGAEAAETNAGQSASTASTKAAEAAQSATDAAASETAAEAAATRAETAAATLTVDNALSDTSVNPVQNKVITGEVTQLKSHLNEIRGSTRNVFDPTYLVTKAGWSETEGVYSGTAAKLHQNFNTSPYYPIEGFKASKRYTISLTAKTDGNEGTSGNGIMIYFIYSDGTQTGLPLPNTTSSYTRFTLTSSAGKTVSGLRLTYGGNGGNVWHIHDIQLEEGTTATDYIQHFTAVDIIARAEAESLKSDIDVINDKIAWAETVNIPWENGNIYITPTQIYYNQSSADKRIRTPQGYILKLNAGDTVAISPTDGTVQMYVGWRLPGGGYSYVGWISTTYTAEIDSEYYILAHFNPERTLESVEELSQYITVTRYANVRKELAELDEQTAELDERVTALESGITPVSEIPEYFEANLASAISEAQTAMLSASINGETFVFLSDIHWENNEKHSPALVKAVTDALPIENTFYGGDTFNGGTQEKVIGIMNDVRQKFTAASPHFLSVYGNHDGNQLDGGTAFTHDEFYTLMQKQSDYYVEYEAPCYYYMDNKATKTRFIVLDSRTGTPSTASAQISWLQSITNNAPAGWHFLVFCHVIYYPGEGGTYDDPTTWIMSPFMTNVCTALDAVNTAGGKKVEAIFGGHCHIDYNGQTSGGIPIVMIDCDTKQTVSGNPQTAGTTGEQCLDIVTVNYSAEEIHCARIGRGASRTITY